MPKASATIQVSVTEMPQFRRLAEFATAVGEHADSCDDDRLEELVRDLRVDLLRIMATPVDPPERFET